jgi:hypothetical protein
LDTASDHVDRKPLAAIHESAGSKRLVAVVTPVVKFPLSADEAVSLRHLREYLGGFDRYIIGPRKLPKDFSDFKLRPFAAKYFMGVYDYNRLLLTEKFYRAFTEYEYILIYQLDCLVFANNLADWCERGWDYVGAPWLRDRQDPAKGFSGVGNGGFSLRKVKAALSVFGSKQIVDDPNELAHRAGRAKLLYEGLKWAPPLQRLFVKIKRSLHRRGYHNDVHRFARELADVRHHEDYFWAFESSKFLSEFRIPEPQEALGFSFEMAPRYCFEVNGGRLPFGCHAWSKYDRKFWEPFLLK